MDIKKWFKDYHHVILAVIILFAIIIRLYYFVPTLNQPLWWDEAEYMNMAKAWAFGTDYNFIPVRPVLFSFITAIFFKIVFSEFFPRLLLLFLSIISVLGMYSLGKEFYNKKIGLLSAFLMSVFWLNLFFSFRLLVDLPSLTFFIFSILFFYRYLKYNSHKSLYIGAAIVALGVLFRLSTGIFLVCFLFYLLFTQRLSFLKKKELWIAGIIFLLVLSPYLIWGYMQFNGFVIKQAMDWNAPVNGFSFENLWWNASSYFKNFVSYLSWPALILFLIGIFSFYKIFLGIDVIFKGKGGELNKQLFLILLFLFPIIFTSMSFYHHIENRYIITIFPAIFIIISLVIFNFYNYMKKHKQKTLAIIIILLFLGYFAFSQLKHSDSLIESKINSYDGVQKAGEWVKQNLDESTIIYTKSWPQMLYYSDRTTIPLPDTEEEFDPQTNNAIMMISIFEPHEEWMLTYPKERNLVPINAYFLDAERTQPILIIYNMSSS